ncbi:MAG: DUF5011 domain-containing protein [Bacteroidales bacterium]|nr:DUF5011 domain-containing protein [Bacteroidales bacterium]
MKTRILTLLCAAAVIAAVGCTKKTTGLIDVTYYATIELAGDNPYVVQLGSSYAEPGFTATLNGEDISGQVTVDSNVDTSSPGIYSVTYTAVNADGFSSSVVRDVYVLNPGGIDNVYMSHARMGSRDYNNLPIVISKVSDGVYELEDLCGGFYCYGRYPGYEPTYDFHADVQFSLAEDGSFIIKKIGNWYFKNSFNYENITGGYDAETGIFDYDFDDLLVTLTPLG